MPQAPRDVYSLPCCPAAPSSLLPTRSCVLPLPPQINPGEVKVLRGRTQQVIYSDGTGSDNPYSKLRINIEPTRLAVKVDHVEPQVPNSPVSSSGGHLLGGGDAFSAFRGHGNSSQGCSSQACSSQGESPTESPMQSWRMGANAPPAMAPLPPHMGANGNGGYGSFGNQGFDGSMGAGSFDASMAGIRGSFDGMGGGMGGGMSSAMGSVGLGGGGSFGGANGLPPQSQQQPQQAPSSAVPHSSPMRGYSSYGGPTSYGQTPQQPVF